MTDDTSRLIDALDTIDPARLEYGEWARVLAAASYEGIDPEVLERWSERDAGRYHPGEAARKMAGFNRDGGVTGGTIVHLARAQGWNGTTGERYNRHGQRGAQPPKAKPPRHMPRLTIPYSKISGGLYPRTPSPAEQLRIWVRACFCPDDVVMFSTGYRIGHRENGRTAHLVPIPAKLINEYPEDVRASIDYDPARGCWACVNPMRDAYSRTDADVAAYRNTLIEFDPPKGLDDERIGRACLSQTLRLLAIPGIRALTFSGGKSVHGICATDAQDKAEHAERVRIIYDVLSAQGWGGDDDRRSGTLDLANKNPSRMTRVPGFRRGDRWQGLIWAGGDMRGWGVG